MAGVLSAPPLEVFVVFQPFLQPLDSSTSPLSVSYLCVFLCTCHHSAVVIAAAAVAADTTAAICDHGDWLVVLVQLACVCLSTSLSASLNACSPVLIIYTCQEGEKKRG